MSYRGSGAYLMDILQIMSNEGFQIPISGVSQLRVTTSKVAAVLRFEQCINRNYAREAPVGAVASRMLLKHAGDYVAIFA